jgi:hypothetical protein
VWKLGSKKEHCPSCLGFAGQLKTLREWMNTAIPREQTGISLGSTGLNTSYPHSPYGTFCEDACDCQLVPMKEIKKTIVKPF